MPFNPAFQVVLCTPHIDIKTCREIKGTQASDLERRPLEELNNEAINPSL